MREIRPLGKALYLACLRLPVIIIKAISPMATAEPFGKTSSEEEDKEGQNCWSKKNKKKDAYTESNEQCKPNPMLC